VFPKTMASIHPRWKTPAVAICASSIWAAIMALSGTFEQLLTYVVFAGWAFYALGACSIFYYRRTEPNAPRPFRVPGYPWTPLLFAMTASAIVLNTIVLNPRQALIGVVLILLGVPAFHFWRHMSRRLM
jgi:APA family basic amino acid/polyamine antiporter